MNDEKLLWFYCFQYFAFFVRTIQVRGPKIERPNKIPGSLSDPQTSGNFAKPERYLKNFPSQKNRISQISNPKI